MAVEGNGIHRVYGLPIAGWLTMHGLVMKSCNRCGRKTEFAFWDPDERGQALERSWPASEAARYYAALRALMDIWDTECPRRPRNGRLFRTPQVSLAGWLARHDFELWWWRRNGPNFRFAFLDPDGRAARVVSKWPSSEAARFDSALKEVKDLLRAA